MNTHEITNNETGAESPAIQSLQTFCRSVGISPLTAWRFRQRGWLSTVNIAGRPYVTSEGVAEFKRRAAAGEFAKKHKHPFKSARMLAE